MFENINEVILKVTRDCNLRCQYCYVKDKDRYKHERMSLEMFRRIIQRIVQDKQKSIRESLPQELQIIFHGGEPTLLGPDMLEQFIDIARQSLPRVSFGMQTNMTNLNDAWIRFFKKYQIRPGVSIDGWTPADNTLRTSEQLIDKLNLLNDSGVGYGPLMVLTKTNIKNFFSNAQAIVHHARVPSIKANYVENTSSPKHGGPEVTAAELFTYVFLPTMRYFFDYNHCLEENIQSLLRVYVDDLVFNTDHGQKQHCLGNCAVKFCGGGNNVIEIDPDGTVCFCGRWADVNALNQIGTISDTDLFGFDSYWRTLQVQAKKVEALREKRCDSCYARAICSYGCAAFAYDKYGKVTIRQDLVCQYSKKIKKYFDQHRYEVLIHYVKSNVWEICEEDKFYFLNIPLQQEYVQLNTALKDRSLAWVVYNGKVYLRLDKRKLRGKKVFDT
jgi:uncharacterized protein